MNQIDLRNRHAIVTGAAQGIGLAIARRLLESGASVSMWDRDEQLLSNAVISWIHKIARLPGASTLQTLSASRQE